MSKTEYIKNLGKQAGIAAVLTALFTFLINSQQQTRADFSGIYERQERQIQRLEEKVYQLEMQNVELQAKITTLSSLNYESPVPTWFKDLQGNMVTLNAAYEETFLKPNGKDRYDYIGKTDLEFWGQELGDIGLAESYRQADLDVMMKREQIRSENQVNINGNLVDLIIIKYPVWSAGPDWNGKKMIGVGGVAIVKNCE